ncbi:MAG TPA: phytanoyl-CoA dioxygenase family protein [Ilumatobacteraceae bacterium]
MISSTAIDALLGEPFPVADDEVAAYEANGWARLAGLIPREVIDALAERFDEVSQSLRKTGGGADDPYFTNERYHRQHRIYNDPANVDPLFRVVAHSRRLARAAAALMRSEQVVYLRTTVFEKPPAAEQSLPTTLHQDFPYFPIDRSGSVQIWIALTDLPIDSGTLRFVTGSHRAYGVVGRTNVLEEEQRRLAQRFGVLPMTAPQAMHAGDATAHHDLTLHGADANAWDRARRGFTVTFLPPDARYTGAPYWVTDDLGLPINAVIRHERLPLL